MTPHVGQVIRLEDARGCWRLHIVSLRDKRFDDAIEIPAGWQPPVLARTA